MNVTKAFAISLLAASFAAPASAQHADLVVKTGQIGVLEYPVVQGEKLMFVSASNPLFFETVVSHTLPGKLLVKPYSAGQCNHILIVTNRDSHKKVVCGDRR